MAQGADRDAERLRAPELPPEPAKQGSLELDAGRQPDRRRDLARHHAPGPTVDLDRHTV
jgi:hypothetical protein